MEMRLAHTDEFQAVRDFYWELIDLLEGKEHTAGWIKGVYPSDEFLAESINRQELYILERGGKIIASVVVNHSWNEGYEGLPWALDCSAKEVLVPHALGVHPNLHCQGIGKLVTGEVIELAKEQGVKTVRLDVLGGNIPAERLYTSLGFTRVAAKEMYYADTGWTEYIMYELVL